MTALQLFKEAGIEDMLNSVKDEWTNGDYLKPMAIGGGIGGLGYGANAMLNKGEEGEKGSDKTKRVLSQMLKGTALGGLAGGAVGGVSKLYKGLINSDGESKSESSPSESQKKPSGNFEEFRKDHSVVSPVLDTAKGAGTGLGAGYVAGSAAERFNPASERVTKLQESPGMRDYNTVKEMVQPGTGKGFGVLQSAVNSSSHPQGVKLMDLLTGMGGGYSPGAASAIGHQMGQHMNSLAGSNTPNINRASPGDILDFVKALSANPSDPSLAGKTGDPAVKKLMTKVKEYFFSPPQHTPINRSVDFNDLDIISRGDSALSAARTSRAHKGGSIGAALGTTYGLYNVLKGGDKGNPIPEGQGSMKPGANPLSQGLSNDINPMKLDY